MIREVHLQVGISLGDPTGRWVGKPAQVRERADGWIWEEMGVGVGGVDGWKRKLGVGVRRISAPHRVALQPREPVLDPRE